MLGYEASLEVLIPDPKPFFARTSWPFWAFAFIRIAAGTQASRDVAPGATPPHTLTTSTTAPQIQLCGEALSMWRQRARWDSEPRTTSTLFAVEVAAALILGVRFEISRANLQRELGVVGRLGYREVLI